MGEEDYEDEYDEDYDEDEDEEYEEYEDRPTRFMWCHVSIKYPSHLLSREMMSMLGSVRCHLICTNSTRL